MEEIYSRYRTGNPSFEGTVSLLQELIRSRGLTPEWRRIWVGGSNAGGRVRFIFTLFESDGHLPLHYNGYIQLFFNAGNFRQYRPIPEGVDGYENEIRLMNQFVDTLRNGVLRGYIS